MIVSLHSLQLPLSGIKIAKKLKKKEKNFNILIKDSYTINRHKDREFDGEYGI